MTRGDSPSPLIPSSRPRSKKTTVVSTRGGWPQPRPTIDIVRSNPLVDGRGRRWIAPTCQQGSAAPQSDKMTMAIDQRQLGTLGFDHLPYSSANSHFANPWTASTSAASTAHFLPATVGSSNHGFDALAKQQTSRTGPASIPYTSVSTTAPSIGAAGGFSTGAYGQQDLLNLSQDFLTSTRTAYDQTGSTSQAPALTAFAPTQASYLGSFGNLTQPSPQDHGRRLSQQ